MWTFIEAETRARSAEARRRNGGHVELWTLGRRAVLVLSLLLVSGCSLLGESEAEKRWHALVESPEPAIPAPQVAQSVGPTEEEKDIQRKPLLGLLDCTRLAVIRSERLHAEAERVHQADLGTVAAVSALSPTAAWDFTYFRQRPNVPFSEGGVKNQQQEQRFLLDQPVFRGFSDWFAIAAAADQVEVNEARLRAAKLDVALSCGKAFYAVAALERTVETLVHSLKLEDDRLAEVKAREDNGLARKTERLFIEADRARTEAELAAARHNLTGARAELGYFTGVPDAVLDAQREPPRPLELDHYMEGVDARPDIAVLAHQVELDRHNIWVARGGFLPTIDVLSDLYANRDGTNTNTWWDMSVVLNWPIWEGGKTFAASRVAESHAREDERNYADGVRHARTEIASAYQALLASLDQIPALETRVRASEENVKLLDQEYRAGIASNLEAVDAENTRRQANLDLERELYDARSLELQLRAASGDETLAPGAYPPSAGDVEPPRKK
jgi:outer membrane protein TolC